jgi:hypothetical protein
MVRNLKAFVTEHLPGQVDWERVKLTAGDDGEVVEIAFAFGRGQHVVRVESPDYSPPNGRVLLDTRDLGPIDVTSWEAVARALRGSGAAHEVNNERHGLASRT